MHAAVRPYATAGVVLVGASVIAVTPIESATPPDIRIANTAVQLTAVESAWAFYPRVVRAHTRERRNPGAEVSSRTVPHHPSDPRKRGHFPIGHPHSPKMGRNVGH